MKMIVAVIKPHALEGVRDALKEAGVEGMTLSEVKGYGRQGGHTEVYRGAEYQIEFVPKLRLEIVVENERSGEIVEVIANAARTGKIGDGKIFVLPVENIVRVRTGETDRDAI
ncbi:MAG: P-II family nitrogen regulator [Neomegalonema sp.]|nr:P-II family nitrogen regulator [Neomegalonema sp.]